MVNYQRTPKVFNATYKQQLQKPPRDWSQYKSLWPLFLVFVLVIGGWLFGRLPIFSIKSVEISGTTNQDIIAQLNALKGESIFARKISSTQDVILKQDTTLKNIDCRRGIPNYLRCTITPREPALIWRAGGRDYIVDTNSLVISKIVSTTLQLPIVEDRSMLQVEVGQKVANADLVKIFTNVYQSFTTAGFTVTELFLNDSVYQVGVVLTGVTAPDTQIYPTGKTINILVTINSPLNAQIAATKEIFKNKSAQITSYIDLRVPGTAYIK